MIATPDYRALLATAVAEARQGLAEGGIPIGAALFHDDGRLLGCGHNRRIQENDPSVHGETDAFRKAGRQRRYRDTIMVTTLAPCWYCSGLVRQFNIGTVVVGESVNFAGGLDWLRENGVDVIDLADAECIAMLGDYIAAQSRGLERGHRRGLTDGAPVSPDASRPAACAGAPVARGCDVRSTTPTAPRPATQWRRRPAPRPTCRTGASAADRRNSGAVMSSSAAAYNPTHSPAVTHVLTRQ